MCNSFATAVLDGSRVVTVSEDRTARIGQVRAMWQRLTTSTATIFCGANFVDRIEVETGSKEDLAIQLTEGWILGCSPTATTQ